MYQKEIDIEEVKGKHKRTLESWSADISESRKRDQESGIRFFYVEPTMLDEIEKMFPDGYEKYLGTKDDRDEETWKYLINAQKLRRMR